jgi:hypothetical protein
MKQSQFAKLAVFLAATMILSGCVWEGYGPNRGENHHDRDRGDQHERDHGDRGDHHGDEH